MAQRILAFLGSPRLGGNTDILLTSLLEAAKEAGAEVKKIALARLCISPCLECGGCDHTGECILRDDMAPLYRDIYRADVLIVASPMFFYNITAYTQALVERAQASWVRKYSLKKGPPAEKEPRGIFLALGATWGPKLFEGAIRVVRYFFDAFYAHYEGGLFYRGIEKKGAISEHPQALKEAQALGKALGQGLPPKSWPLNRRLTP